ncbi:hypothetical protein AMATHDRAFT_72941 [Amanita thiersii Skay4041]|uniref:Pentacotripeptide-repeat region of PRORP domain-containing protein n=1 Tax=Amanita thiersii Skay4041 TaxID=703135 RepID=A0A2A9P091_9AGAR|nr:hypothetical protein AMATHDRAFT_72941 [Amanita thiersii Skay4041]
MHRFSYIPSGLVRHFYCCAAEQLLGEEAVAFYSFSRTPEILRQHRYPPPQGTALSWLMHHLTNMSKKTHISRLLATEVVEDNLHIPPQFRSRFISLTAFRGYSLLARKLWERYSVGKDKDLVVGNPGLMVRMTSILAHLIRRVKLSLQSSQGRNAEVEVEMLEHQLQDLTLFQRRVLVEFRASNEPLTDAPHAVITSFARACFIVGDITEGFKLLKLILRRKEVPDMYDVNVALTALAEHDHRTAAQILERMLAKKIQPDVVSYATVMHYAQLRNDKEMVDKMIERIRVSNDTQLSLKSVASLIRATVDFENEDTESTKQAKLQTAMEIIRTLTPDKFLRSQQIGKYLVAASLRANDGGMAYRFWRLLIRQSTEWEDREQVFQRRLIIQAVERQMKEGRIEKGAGKWMVTRLRHRFEADLGR